MSITTTRRLKGRALERIIERNTFLGIRRRNCEYCGALLTRMTKERFRELGACNQCGQEVYQGG